MFSRSIEPQATKALDAGLVAIIYGSRQVGKTTLAKHIAKSYQYSLYLNCDDPTVTEKLSNQSAEMLKSVIGNNQVVVIDEAQRVENIGLTLKIIHDTYPEVRLLVTGSSSLDLANKVSEPLTGRSAEIRLHPLSIAEVSENYIQQTNNVSKLLTRGGYPKQWTMSNDESREYLLNLATQYIYRDAFGSNTIVDNRIIYDLLRALAYQIGNEVSYRELAELLQIDKDTVKRYILLLEHAFIIFRLPQYRRNQRVAIGKLRKIYFWDLGVRNGLIDNFDDLDFRSDKGVLWENFCIVERQKKIQRDKIWSHGYYWRDRSQEIDYIEEVSGEISSYEFKFSPSKTAKQPKSFADKYPDTEFDIINSDNVLEFIV